MNNLIPSHGGDIYNYDKNLIDFSSNINPLGYPKELDEIIKSSFDDLLKYPDVEYRELRSKIAKYLETDMEYIEVGNGSVEIIDMVISFFKRVFIFEPSFSEYRLRAEVHGLDIVSINLDKSFEFTLDKLEGLREGDLIIITNPSNPTGKTLTKEILEEIYLKVVDVNAYLLLDEAFFEFSDLDYDSVKFFKKLAYSNVGIVRAMTKFFGLPGIRLGYGVFEKDIIEKFSKKRLPWSVNSFAVNSSDILFNKDYIDKSFKYVKEAREILFNNLKSIKGISPVESNANFLLLKIDGASEDYIFRELLDRNILVRRCSNYKNLDGTYIRVAVKTRELNEILYKALKEIMEG